MRYFSMFSGIGGFELGIEKANQEIRQLWDRESNIGQAGLRPTGDKSDTASRNGRGWWECPLCSCVGYSEIDRYAVEIYSRHFPIHKNYGDATKLVSEEILDFDLLIAGFPCQSFSIAGKRRGFNDTRGTLFFDICRVLRIKRPGYCLLENVKGLLSHNKGETFQVILESLDELGYDCQWQVLNSKYFGVPQNRERVFIIGHLRDKPRPEIFPIRESNQISIRQDGTEPEREQRISSTVDSRYGSLRNAGETYLIKVGNVGSDSQGQRVYSPEGISAQIVSQGGGQGAKTGLYEIPKTAQALQTDGMLYQGSSFGTNNPQSLRAIRQLTPLECERLQGFPDGWTEGVSDTQRYKCLGNAVTVNVIEFIMQRFLKEIARQRLAQEQMDLSPRRR